MQTRVVFHRAAVLGIFSLHTLCFSGANAFFPPEGDRPRPGRPPNPAHHRAPVTEATLPGADSGLGPMPGVGERFRPATMAGGGLVTVSDARPLMLPGARGGASADGALRVIRLDAPDSITRSLSFLRGDAGITADSLNRTLDRFEAIITPAGPTPFTGVSGPRREALAPQIATIRALIGGGNLAAAKTAMIAMGQEIQSDYAEQYVTAQLTTVSGILNNPAATPADLDRARTILSWVVGTGEPGPLSGGVIGLMANTPRTRELAGGVGRLQAMLGADRIRVNPNPENLRGLLSTVFNETSALVGNMMIAGTSPATHTGIVPVTGDGQAQYDLVWNIDGPRAPRFEGALSILASPTGNTQPRLTAAANLIRTAINGMPEGPVRTAYLARLDAITPTLGGTLAQRNAAKDGLTALAGQVSLEFNLSLGAARLGAASTQLTTAFNPGETAARTERLGESRTSMSWTAMHFERALQGVPAAQRPALQARIDRAMGLVNIVRPDGPGRGFRELPDARPLTVRIQAYAQARDELRAVAAALQAHAPR